MTESENIKIEALLCLFIVTLYCGPFASKLTILPNSFGNLIKLTRLTLDWQGLTCLPKSIGNLINITELDLSDNELSRKSEHDH